MWPIICHVECDKERPDYKKKNERPSLSQISQDAFWFIILSFYIQPLDPEDTSTHTVITIDWLWDNGDI